MTSSDPNALHVFTVTTDKYEVGDEFGFAVIKAGCTVEEEQACAVDPTKCEHAELCDHRYDSGSAVDTATDAQDYTCGWSRNTLCSSKSPFTNLTLDARTCLADPNGAWLNRVVPANHGGAISAVWGSCATQPGDAAGGDPGECHAAAVDRCTVLATPPPAAPTPPPVPNPPPFNNGDRPPSPAFYDMTHTVDGDTYNRATPLVIG